MDEEENKYQNLAFNQRILRMSNLISTRYHKGKINMSQWLNLNKGFLKSKQIKTKSLLLKYRINTDRQKIESNAKLLKVGPARSK